MIRASVTVLLALALGATVVQASDAPSCTIAVKGDSPVVKACQEGGIPKAKRTMKEMVRAGKAKGMNLECNDCHTAIDEWKLNQGASDKFRKLVELTR
jgi:hypothetical protein